jgi:hypothetical protein
MGNIRISLWHDGTRKIRPWPTLLVSNGYFYSFTKRADHLVPDCPTLNMRSVQVSVQILDDVESVRTPTVATVINYEIIFRRGALLSWTTKFQFPQLSFKLKTTYIWLILEARVRYHDSLQMWRSFRSHPTRLDVFGSISQDIEIVDIGLYGIPQPKGSDKFL